MLNPFQYVERLMEFQHRFSPVIPLLITRKVYGEHEFKHSWIIAIWFCGNHYYKMKYIEGDAVFIIKKFEIITPSDYLPSIRGYYETVSFHHTCIMFDEIEFTGNNREKLIPLEKKIRIQTIKEQCFK